MTWLIKDEIDESSLFSVTQKLNEEAFAHATIQYNMQAGSLRTEVIAINSALDKERVTREKLDAEVSKHSMNTEHSCLQAIDHHVPKCSSVRNSHLFMFLFKQSLVSFAVGLAPKTHVELGSGERQSCAGT